MRCNHIETYIFSKKSKVIKDLFYTYRKCKKCKKILEKEIK
jgi:hypothetical protein